MLRSLSATLALILIVLVGAANAPIFAAGEGTTIPAGTITTNTTWTLANSPYRLNGQVTVADNVTLTIEPGVEVIGAVNQGLYVDGAIIAVGTAEQPIRFRAGNNGQRGAWYGLRIGDFQFNETDSNNSRLSHVIASNGGFSAGASIIILNSTPTQLDNIRTSDSSYDGLMLQNAGPVTVSDVLSENNTRHGIHVNGRGGHTLNDITVRNNGGSGITSNAVIGGQVIQGSGNLTLSNLTSENNVGYGFLLDIFGAPSNISNSTVSGNGVAGQVPAGSLLTNISYSNNTRAELELNAATVTASRTWANIPNIEAYRLIGSTAFADGTTLTIEPGVTVLMAGWNGGLGGLEVRGVLNAVGTADAPITFRAAGSTNRGAWGSLLVGRGTTNDSGASRINHLVIEHGGASGPMLFIGEAIAQFDNVTARNSSRDGVAFVATGPMTISDVLAENNGGNGVVFVGNGGQTVNHLTARGNGGGISGTNSYVGNGVLIQSVTNGQVTPAGGQVFTNLIANNNQSNGLFHEMGIYPLTVRGATFEGNTQAAIHHQTTGVEFSYHDVTATGNGVNGVAQPLGTVAFPGDPTSTWDAPGLPIFVNGSVTLGQGHNLTITPGTEMRFAAGTWLNLGFNSALIAEGTAEQPVRFRGQAETPGSWKGINATQGRLQLARCEVVNGGADMYMITISQSASSIQRCLISGSANDGILVDNNATPTLSRNRIVDNAFGVRNISTNADVDARNNWWGSASGPFHPTLNADGEGNEVSDQVLFDPWLTTPEGELQPAPDTTITAGPSGNTGATTAQFSFAGNGGNGALSFECALDGAPFAACTSPMNYTSLTPGAHTFRVRAVDAEGLTDETPAERTWTVQRGGAPGGFTIYLPTLFQ